MKLVIFCGVFLLFSVVQFLEAGKVSAVGLKQKGLWKKEKSVNALAATRMIEEAISSKKAKKTPDPRDKSMGRQIKGSNSKGFPLREKRQDPECGSQCWCFYNVLYWPVDGYWTSDCDSIESCDLLCSADPECLNFYHLHVNGLEEFYFVTGSFIGGEWVGWSGAVDSYFCRVWDSSCTEYIGQSVYVAGGCIDCFGGNCCNAQECEEQCNNYPEKCFGFHFSQSYGQWFKYYYGTFNPLQLRSSSETSYICRQELEPEYHCDYYPGQNVAGSSGGCPISCTSASECQQICQQSSSPCYGYSYWEHTGLWYQITSVEIDKCVNRIMRDDPPRDTWLCSPPC